VPDRHSSASPAPEAAREAAFAHDGYALLERFVNPDELAGLRTEVDDVLAQPLPPGCERPNNTLAPLRFDHAIVRRMLGSQGRLAAVAAGCGARDLRWISAYVSVKEPHSAALWWHQDWWCWDHPVSRRPDAPQVAVLLYLADTGADNAALRVLPGTHRRTSPLHAALPEAHTSDAARLALDHVAMRDHPDQVTLEVRAGDAVVTDYRLLHGTHPNGRDERRDCLVLTFAPDWSGLPDDIRAHLIRHPALPTPAERVGARTLPLGVLPAYDGEPRDLPLNRTAPAELAG
jgi:hypothetical protein